MLASIFRKKSLRVLLIVAVSLVFANVAHYLMMRAGHNYVAWYCWHCGARLSVRPAQGHAFLFFDMAYASPAHEWGDEIPGVLAVWTWLDRILSGYRPEHYFNAAHIPAGASKSDGLCSAYLLESDVISGRAITALLYDAGVRRPSPGTHPSVINARLKALAELTFTHVRAGARQRAESFPEVLAAFTRPSTRPVDVP